MSAYIVEIQTIERIVTYMMKDSDRTHKDYQSIATNFGQLLWDTNQLSVNQRYRETDVTPTYTHTDRKASKIEVYKSLANWLYQSCEGVCMQLDAYRDMVALQTTIAHTIVKSLPEYTEGKWS